MFLMQTQRRKIIGQTRIRLWHLFNCALCWLEHNEKTEYIWRRVLVVLKEHKTVLKDLEPTPASPNPAFQPCAILSAFPQLIH